jgi:hypothetical protein
MGLQGSEMQRTEEILIPTKTGHTKILVVVHSPDMTMSVTALNLINLNNQSKFGM